VCISESDADGDFDIEDIELERLASTLNLFPQLDSKGVIGSVHTSAVRLLVSESPILCEDTEDFPEFYLPKTSRRVVSSRRNMQICGGQGYLPVIKSNTLIEQRQHLEKLSHLPLLLQRVLTSTQGSFDQDKTKVKKEIIAKFHTLEVLLEGMSKEWKNSGKNTVRFEFFVTSTLRNARCDITMPVPDPWQLLAVVRHSLFKESWSDYTAVYMTPLRKFVSDLKDNVQRKEVLQVSKIGPEIRTCLLFCSEKCVQAANLRGFRGRIIEKIWLELRHTRYGQDYFVVPSTVLVKVDESRFHRYALHNPRIVQPSTSEDEDADGDNSGKCISMMESFLQYMEQCLSPNISEMDPFSYQ
jgi:hypothetical protein